MLKQNKTELLFYMTELVFYVVCACLVFWKTIQWPGVGSWWVLVYFFIFPAFIDRAFHLFYFLWQKKVLEGKWKKSLVVILSIVLGVILTGQINQKASLWAMKRFQDNYQPLVEYLQNDSHNDSSHICKDLETFISKRPLQGRESPKALYFKGEYFILEFLGNSIDIDASTIYFNSRTGQWHIFHNDDVKRRNQLGILIKDMRTCGKES